MKVPAFRPYYGRSEAEGYLCELLICVSEIRFWYEKNGTTNN
jgi:hypothetical protein